MAAVRTSMPIASPGRNVGCGLKLLCRPTRRHRHVASPGRNVGCGLKQRRFRRCRPAPRITRQKCRVWIETGAPAWSCFSRTCITRQKCRVWIETPLGLTKACHLGASPGRNVGCGLKPLRQEFGQVHPVASPGRNVGCGLKLRRGMSIPPMPMHHPAEMSGVD